MDALSFMKKPKKIYILGLVICLVLLFTGGCVSSSPEAPDTQTNIPEEQPVNEERTKEKPTQEELDAQLKQEATEVDFIEVNGDKVDKGTKLTVKGEVSVVTKKGIGGEFTLTTEEGDGYGMYSVINMSLEEVSEGDIVEAWGTYNGKNELGMPVILATIIEKK